MSLAGSGHTTLVGLEFRPGTPGDAPRIEALIKELAPSIFGSDSQEEALVFWQSVSAQAEAGYLEDPRYSFLLALEGEKLAGFLAMRDKSHLFHLFVATTHQGLGLATYLWRQAYQSLDEKGYKGPITVNSTLRAVGFYQKLGFHCDGPVIKAGGIAFQPMAYPAEFGLKSG